MRRGYRHASNGILTGMGSDRNPAQGPVVIRGATERDLPALVDLTIAFYEEDGFAIVPGTVLEARLSRFLSQADANVAIAVESDVTVGFALTTMRLILESGLVAELQDLYVVPDYRGLGVGSALVADAAQWAKDGSATTLEVVIAPNGRDVSHLDRYYASLGFEDERRRLVHLDL